MIFSDGLPNLCLSTCFSGSPPIDMYLLLMGTSLPLQCPEKNKPLRSGPAFPCLCRALREQSIKDVGRPPIGGRVLEGIRRELVMGATESPIFDPGCGSGTGQRIKREMAETLGKAV